ncbi:hypothetical protein IMCC3317_16610 [Kordia antarctica]|uniref:Uncharacterized protein n=1 Tax=Kordia antarctica TaxID=1218801 RepID=A0A7L4ZIH4_9FLAO|nr:hypothetical protein [Kordia antarctica]QHI36301.1 hypothetical protein IMCC3317_16610 [Kordia antarctica]
MANLQDYLGTLVASVNQARVLADIESANIAEQYAQHRLLKHFSIPRMKMQNVEFTIPVAIDHVETTEPRDYQPIDNKDFVSKAYDELTNVYQVRSFDRTSSLQLRKMLYMEADLLETRLKAGENIQVALQQFSDKVSGQALEIKTPSLSTSTSTSASASASTLAGATSKKAKAAKEATTISRDAMSQKILTRLQPEVKAKEMQRNIENANVIVEASRLREQKTENMVFIKMTVLEESMEWHTIENEDGTSRSTLSPE